MCLHKNILIFFSYFSENAFCYERNRRARSSSLKQDENPIQIVVISPTPSVDNLLKHPKFKHVHEEFDEIYDVDEEDDDMDKKITTHPNPPTLKVVLKPYEINLAITLIAISLLFIICQSVKLIPDVYEMIHCDHFELADKDRVCIVPRFIDFCVSVSNLFCCINSAGNFMLYMLRGKKFRDAFIKMYCQCIPNSRKPNSPIGLSMNTFLDPNTTNTTKTILTNGVSTRNLNMRGLVSKV